MVRPVNPPPKKKYQKEIDELKRRLEEAAAEVDLAKSSRHNRLSAKGEKPNILEFVTTRYTHDHI